MVESGIKIYHHPNPQIKSFLTDTAISVPRVEAFRKPLDSSNEDVLKQIGSIAGQIVRDIMSIPGVLEIRIKPKEIRMKKEESAGWEEIERQVLAILKRALRRKQIRMIKG